jgi:hypothetical protein
VPIRYRQTDRSSSGIQFSTQPPRQWLRVSMALPVFDRLMERGEYTFPGGAVFIHSGYSVYPRADAALLGGRAHKIDFRWQEPDNRR